MPRALAWDRLAAVAVRLRVLDAAFAEALPGYTCYAMTAAGRSLWFYYEGPARPGGRSPSLELQIRFDDGKPVVPLVNCWTGEPDILGPVAHFAGDEAIACNPSLTRPGASGTWINARVGHRRFFLRDGDASFAALTRVARALAAALPTLPLPTSFELDASEREQPNPDYIALDQAMFARITPGLLENPPRLDALTPSASALADPDLGFGYRLENRVAGGGYLSLFGTVLWKETEPLFLPVTTIFPPGSPPSRRAGVPEALRIATYYPRAPAPPEVYREFFQPIFGPQVGPTDERPQRYWNYSLAAEPLPAGWFHVPLPGVAEIADHPDRATIAWLMTPFSGTTYSGYHTKEVSEMFTDLDQTACLFLLRSKNPATRLMAIEILRRNASTWSVDLHALDPDFNLIYRSAPTVFTQRGDVLRRENARTLVDRFVARAE